MSTEKQRRASESGKRIFLLRSLAKLSQKDFAKKVGIAAPYLSELENGKKTPGAGAVQDICRIYCVDENWLLNGDDRFLIAHAFHHLAATRGGDSPIAREYFIEAFNTNCLTDFLSPAVREVRGKIDADYLQECLTVPADAPTTELKKRIASATETAPMPPPEPGTLLPSDWFSMCVKLAAEGLTPFEVIAVLEEAGTIKKKG